MHPINCNVLIFQSQMGIPSQRKITAKPVTVRDHFWQFRRRTIISSDKFVFQQYTSLLQDVHLRDPVSNSSTSCRRSERQRRLEGFSRNPTGIRSGQLINMSQKQHSLRSYMHNRVVISFLMILLKLLTSN